MVKRSAVSLLPKEVKAWLDKALVESNFSGYQQLEDELKARGINIGKSQVHRYGQKLEDRLAAIKASTEAAQAIVDAAPDEGDARSEAILGLIQTEMFDAIMKLQEIESVEPEQRVKILASVMKSVSIMARASVNQKKWSTEIREKARAAADLVANVASKGGLTPEAIQSIRSSILGIADN